MQTEYEELKCSRALFAGVEEGAVAPLFPLCLKRTRPPLEEFSQSVRATQTSGMPTESPTREQRWKHEENSVALYGQEWGVKENNG